LSRVKPALVGRNGYPGTIAESDHGRLPIELFWTGVHQVHELGLLVAAAAQPYAARVYLQPAGLQEGRRGWRYRGGGTWQSGGSVECRAAEGRKACGAARGKRPRLVEQDKTKDANEQHHIGPDTDPEQRGAEPPSGEMARIEHTRARGAFTHRWPGGCVFN